MKKVILLIVSCLFTTTMFAQFEVESTGYSNSSNITMDGVMGVRNGNDGVLTVKSNRIDPKYNSFLGLGLSLIRADCGGFNNVYPFSSINRNKINFYVNSTGQVYSVSGYLQAPASIKLTKSESPVIISPLEKLKNLNGVVYTAPIEQSKTRSTFVDESESPSTMDSATTAQIMNQIEEEENLPRFGLVAEELEQVFPEVVRTLPDGSKGILYTDLVPVLIESIKELQVQVNSLQSQLDNLSVEKAPQKGKSIGDLGQGEAQLYPNTPNPFNQKTEIRYRLSSTANNASICIFNLNGELLKKYPLSVNSQNGSITILASEFTSGMYIYSLLINNQLIDSKRMVLNN